MEWSCVGVDMGSNGKWSGQWPCVGVDMGCMWEWSVTMCWCRYG